MADSSTSRPTASAAQLNTYMAFTLAAGQVVYQGNLAAIDLTTGTVKNGTGSNKSLRVIGHFTRNCDATSGAISCLVALDRPVTAAWLPNDTVAPVTSAYTGQLVYVKDNHTVTLTSTDNCVAGICWCVSALDGVLVEMVPPAPPIVTALSLVADDTSADYDTNDWAPTGASLVSGTIYLEDTTAAASTITLPSTGVSDGTVITLFADGTVNGHAVTIRQGVTSLCAALTASKRHLVCCVCFNGTWAVSASEAP